MQFPPIGRALRRAIAAVTGRVIAFLFLLPASAEDLNTARQLVAVGTYDQARQTLDGLIAAAPLTETATARRLRALLLDPDIRPNPPPDPDRRPPDEWLGEPAPYLLALALDRGVGSLLEARVEGDAIVSVGFDTLVAAAKDAPDPNQATQLLRGLHDHLIKHPWLDVPERDVVRRLLVQRLRFLKRGDEAVDVLLETCLPAVSLTCTGRESDDPVPLRDRLATRPPGLEPLETLLDLCQDVSHRRPLLKRLEECTGNEGILLRQLLELEDSRPTPVPGPLGVPLGGANAPGTLPPSLGLSDYLDHIDQHGLTAFRHLTGPGRAHELHALMARLAENAGQPAAALRSLQSAIDALPPGADIDTVKPLLGGLSRVAQDLPAATTDPVTQRVTLRFVCSDPDRAIRFAAWQRAMDMASDRVVVYKTLRDHCPEHDRLRAFDVDIAFTTDGIAVAEREWFTLLATRPLAALLAVETLPELLAANPNMLSDPRMGRGLLAALREAHPDEAAALQQRIPALAAAGESAQLAWMDLLQKTTAQLTPEEAARSAAFVRAAANWTGNQAATLQTANARRQWLPRLLFPAKALEELGMPPMPGLNPRPTLGLLNTPVLAPLPIETCFLDHRDAGLGDRLAAALKDTDVEPLLATWSGGPAEPGVVSRELGWVTARILRRQNRIPELLAYLEASADLRTTKPLLDITASLASNRVVEARFLLGLGAAPVGTPDEQMLRVKATSQRLHAMGFPRDALRQARRLLSFPAESHRRLGRKLVLDYERDWLANTSPAEVKEWIDARQQQLAADPDNVDLLEECHRLYAYQGQTVAAVNMMRRRANATPDLASPKVRLGVFLAEEAKESEEAWLAFRAAHDIQPSAWLASRKLSLIQKTALNRRDFIDRVLMIEFPPPVQSRANIGQLFNVLYTEMARRPVPFPDRLLVLCDRLLAANPAATHPVKGKLEEFRATLLLATGQRVAAHPLLQKLFKRPRPPVQDLYFGAEGLTGLAVDYFREFGDLPKVRDDFWQVALEAAKMEREGHIDGAFIRYLSLLGEFSDTSIGQARHLLNRLEKLVPAHRLGSNLLPLMTFKLSKKPKLLREICLSIEKTPLSPQMIEKLRLLPYASGLEVEEKRPLKDLLREMEAKAQ